MSYSSERTTEHNGTAFKFECGDEWAKMSADVSRLCRMVGEQMHEALAEVDFEALRREVQTAMDSVAQEVRLAMDNWRADWPAEKPMRVRVDIHAEPEEEPAPRPAADGDERMTVLRLVAEGKITAEDGARLLEALG
jgi:hypothetical protein